MKNKILAIMSDAVTLGKINAIHKKRIELILEPKSMEWISIKEDLPNDGDKVIVWQNNLSDKKCSRHHCAFFSKMDNGRSFFEIYPIAFNILYDSKKKFISGDLEGDTCQLTHWMQLPKPPKISGEFSFFMCGVNTILTNSFYFIIIFSINNHSIPYILILEIKIVSEAFIKMAIYFIFINRHPYFHPLLSTVIAHHRLTELICNQSKVI